MILFRKVFLVFFLTLLFSSLTFTQTPNEIAKSEKSDRLYEAGTQLVSTRNFAQAALLFEEAIKLTPNNYKPYIDLSWMYLELGKYQPAATTAQKAIDLNPKSGMAYNNLGYALTQLARYSEKHL